MIPMPDGGDVVDFLLVQHEAVKQAFEDVIHADDEAKATAFSQLEVLLQVHEAGEQQVVHPVTRDVAGSPEIAEQRVEEERQASSALSELSRMGVADRGFDAAFADLHASVLEHASEEESEEFPRLRATQTTERLIAMAAELRAVQTMAAQGR
jgi:Hemerythrin HHE cation binding domain